MSSVNFGRATEGAPSLRFLQGWAAMHPQVWWLLQFEGRATRLFNPAAGY